MLQKKTFLRKIYAKIQINFPWINAYNYLINKPVSISSPDTRQKISKNYIPNLITKNNEKRSFLHKIYAKNPFKNPLKG